MTAKKQPQLYVVVTSWGEAAFFGEKVDIIEYLEEWAEDAVPVQGCDELTMTVYEVGPEVAVSIEHEVKVYVG